MNQQDEHPEHPPEEGGPEEERSDAAGLSLPEAPEKPKPADVLGNLYRNTDVNIIEVNEEKVRLALQDFAKRAGSNDWIAPLGIDVALFIVLITADFKGRHLGLRAGTWHDIFVIATFVVTVWLAVTVISRLRRGGADRAIDDCIAQIKGPPTKQGARLGL